MVQNNKVLTVSYGTFSCTLEGFEESFDTMKAIAEYFRDLAADDRYFGAEPPQPDAEMLARIAQREITRQVEARTSDTGIHLRASEESPVKPQVEPQDATAKVTTPVIGEPSAPTLTNAPTSATPLPSAEESEPKVDEIDIITMPDESLTDDVPLVDEAVNDTNIVQETALDAAASAVTDPAETTTVENNLTVPEAADIEADTGSDAEAEIWGVEEALTDASAAQTNSDVVIPEPEEELAPTTESIAAKLMRIRSVVTKSNTTEDEFNEDQHAESLSAQDAYREETLRDLEVLLGEDNLLDDTNASETLDAVDAPAEEAEEEDIADLVSQAVEASSEPETSPEGDEIADAKVQSAVSALFEPATTTQQADTAPEPDTQIASDTSASAPEQPEPQVKRGRIIRVRRKDKPTDLIDSTAQDVPETASEVELSQSQIAAVPEVETPLTPNIPSSLSYDDEKDLIAELAAVEAELRAATRPDPAEILDTDYEEDQQDGFSLEALGLDEADQVPATTEAEETISAEPLMGEDDILDGDVSRLMATVDDKLYDVDTVESRATYNQLRAAVAAAQADDIGDDEDVDTKAQAYREDLAQVVRPRRPSKTKARAAAIAKAEIKAKDRPEPLQLVAAQRIDPEPAASRKRDPEGETVERRRTPSILPRRIPSDTAQDTGIIGENTASFAEFAQNQGATELSELLEAAAAYLVKVEGREHFSRPQLLKTVRNLDEDSSPSREDSLRAFGQLLRKGKLDRAENGRFTINAQTAYADRAAG